MLLVVGQYHSSLIASLEGAGQAYEILKDAKRYRDPSALDFSNENTVIEYVKSIAPRPSHAIAMYEQYVPICAKINAVLNTFSLSHGSAMLCTDKVLMRQAFSKFENISPNFEEVTSLDQAKKFTVKYGFPVILKPANLSKSMLVTKCSSPKDLASAIRQSELDAPRLYQKYTLGEKPKFIIEEFMQGSIHTVAAFADADGTITCAPGIVDNISAADIGFEDTFIYSRSLPSQQPEHKQEAMFTCAKKGMEALGMRSTPGHVELILTANGPRIIEIGARLGGYRSKMYTSSYGLDLMQQALHVAQGEKPFFTGECTKFTGVYELFPDHEGEFIRVEGLDDINESLFDYCSVKPNPGDKVGPAKRGYKAAAIIIISSADASEYKQLCKTIDGLHIKVKS